MAGDTDHHFHSMSQCLWKKNSCAIKCTAGVHRYVSTHAHSVANVNKFPSKTIWCTEKSGKKDDSDGGGGSGGNSSSSNNGRGT